MQEIARRHNVHPATICVKWAVQNGQIPIPLSLTPKNYCANLRSAVEDPLTPEEMQQIRALDCNMRLVKGHGISLAGGCGLVQSVGSGWRYRPDWLGALKSRAAPYNPSFP